MIKKIFLIILLLPIYAFAVDDTKLTTMSVKRLPDGSAKVTPSMYSMLKNAGVFTNGPMVDAGADVVVKPKAVLALPNNKKVIVDVVAKIPKAQIAKAMAGKIASKLPYIGPAIAIATLDPQLASLLPDWLYNPETKSWTKPNITPGMACEKPAGPDITWCGSHRGEDHTAQGYCQLSDDGNCTFYGVLVPSYTPGPPDTFNTEELANKIAMQPNWPEDIANWATNPDNLPLIKGEPEIVSITGPSSADGETSTTTTTGPNGDVQTTTTTTNHQITYSGDKYNITTTTNTTTVNQAGDVINNTSTTTTAPTPAQQIAQQAEQQAEKEKEPSECEQNPMRVGCQELEAPTGEDIPKENRMLTLQDGGTYAGGGCIPDVFVTVNGHSIKALDTTLPCGWISDFLKPLLLLFASVTAVFIVMPREV